MGSGDESDLRLGFARLEGKVDLVITRHDMRLEQIEETQTDHEERLRSLEAIPYVTPKGLWAVIGGVISAAVAVTILLNWLDTIIN